MLRAAPRLARLERAERAIGVAALLRRTNEVLEVLVVLLTDVFHQLVARRRELRGERHPELNGREYAPGSSIVI